MMRCPRMRRFPTIALVVAAGVLVAASPASAGSASAKLPPSDRASLARIFDPKLAPLGLRVTRAALQELGTYNVADDGRHLAIYVEPIADDYSTSDYVKNIVPVARVFLPLVFKRWSGLRSFDVCQEPLPSDDPSTVPPPVTQVAVSRRGVKRVHWRDAKLVDVLAAEPRSERERQAVPTLFHFYANRVVRADPTYQRAVERARQRA